MATFVKYFCGSCLLSIFLISCASVSRYDRADEAVLRGDFAQGVQELESQKDLYNKETDEVLIHLDMGMLTHYTKDYGRSADHLQSGERAIEAAFTRSITRDIGSYLLNDNTLEYAGEDYEDIYINVFNSLNYYHRGNLEGALVEIRRINNKLRALSTKYGTMITNLQRSMLEREIDIPYDPEAATVTFTDSALARYMSMIFYRGEGLWDDVRIDRDFLKLAFANQPVIYPFPLPSSIDKETEIPKGKARLNVISFNGFSPVKVEETMRIPLLITENYLKIALPVMHSRPSLISFTEVQMDTGERFELELIEDIDLVAKETFKMNQSAIYLRSIIRSVAKTTTATALNTASDKSNDRQSSMLLGILGAGVQVFAEVSEQADIRLSHYFPGKALVGGINLDPGVHSFTVYYYDQRHNLLYQERFENISVRENQLNLVEAVCLK